MQRDELDAYLNQFLDVPTKYRDYCPNRLNPKALLRFNYARWNGREAPRNARKTRKFGCGSVARVGTDAQRGSTRPETRKLRSGLIARLGTDTERRSTRAGTAMHRATQNVLQDTDSKPFFKVLLKFRGAFV
jgi:hypothetical protein